MLSVSDGEFLVGEATCQGDSGGPALDETTGEIVGVVSRGGRDVRRPGAHNMYTRTDVFQSLIAEALSMSVFDTEASTDDGGADAGKEEAQKEGRRQDNPAERHGRPLHQRGRLRRRRLRRPISGKEYCSRSCGTGDRCPDHFHCTATSPRRRSCLASDLAAPARPRTADCG